MASRVAAAASTGSAAASRALCAPSPVAARATSSSSSSSFSVGEQQQRRARTHRVTAACAAAPRPRLPTLLLRGPQSWSSSPPRLAPIVRSSAAPTTAPATATEQPITLTPAAMRQLERLRREEGRPSVLLRMGVRAGGCSGMSYDMKFEDEANVDAEDDTVLEFAWEEGGSEALEGMAD